MTYWSYIAKALRPHRRRLVVAVAAMLGIMLVDLGSPLVVAALIDRVVTRGQYDLLAPLMLGLAVLPVLAGACRFTSDYAITVVSQRLLFDIRLDLYRNVQRLSCRFLQNTPKGKLMERLREDVQQLQVLLSHDTPHLAVQVVTGLVMLVILLALSVKLALLVLGAIALYALNYAWFMRRMRIVQRRYRRHRDQLSALAQERLAATVMVKTFGSERQELRTFIRRNYTTERQFHRFRMFNVWYGTLARSITWGTYVMVLLYGSYLAVQGKMSFGTVLAATAFSLRLLWPAATLAELSNQIQQAKVSLDRIFQLLTAERDVVHLGGRRLAALKGEVAFENVHFRYDADRPVLQGFSLRVEPGRTVALVGQTGCGKSTVINLLYRFYDISAGNLLVDGHDIRGLEPRWYRRHLALVPQDPIVFDTTVAQNIAYGRPRESRGRILHAAEVAGLSELIEELPDGLDTLLGERGVKLSVGERQRLCIARAVLADPAILIFDEATSSLDSRGEQAIQQAMKRVMAGRTCVVVAHRLSTIVDADQIVVMDAGRVIERGTHAELMARPLGRYRQLLLTQMAGPAGPGVG